MSGTTIRPKRIVYLGTPAVAVPPLRGLHEAGFEVVLVVTGPDRRRGRGSATSPSPVKAAALKLGIPVAYSVDDLLDVEADLGVVVAFGQLIRENALDHLDFVNLHYSLLPRWRGAAPIERAILAGDTKTGVCLMQLDAGLDTGGIYERVEVPITAADTADDLRERLTEVGASILIDSLTQGLQAPTPQRGETIFAEKLGREDFVIDWNDPAEQVNRVARIGGALTQFRGKGLKVWDSSVVLGHSAPIGSIEDGIVGCGRDGLRLVVVQPEGKARLAAKDWLNGAQLGPDDRLEAP